MGRAKLTERQALIKQAREGAPVERKELPAKVTCPACGRDQWPDADGNPRYHERPARPGDPAYRAELPVMVGCRELTLAEHHEALPDELRITPDMLPADVADAFAYLVERDALTDAGASKVLSYAAWVASRG